MTAGELLHHESVETSLPGTVAWRIRYASRDCRGAVHETTGLVVAPAGSGTDRPVLTWCHGTTGLGNAACPSLQPDPVRDLTVYFDSTASQQIDYGVPGLLDFINDGWVVCATDYQGLGTEGMHQYLVNRTNARDAVNIAHAAHALPVGAGTRLGCIGWSQGGGTAAAIAELDPEDYGDLRLIGTVPMSPAVASVAVGQPAGPAAAMADHSIPPDDHLIMLLAGAAAADPDLHLEDVLTPLGVRIVEQAWNIQPVHHLNDTIARMFRLRGPVLRPDPPRMQAWLDSITAGSAAQHRPVAPVLVCQDSFDGGTVVPVAWQQAYVDAVTASGGAVELRDYPDADHFSLPGEAVADARTWLTSLL